MSVENSLLKDFYPEIPESRRKDLTPPAYVRNGSIYVLVRNIIKYKTRLGKNIKPYIMPQERTINIDEKEDLIMAQILMKKEIQKILFHLFKT